MSAISPSTDYPAPPNCVDTVAPRTARLPASGRPSQLARLYRSRPTARSLRQTSRPPRPTMQRYHRPRTGRMLKRRSRARRIKTRPHPTSPTLEKTAPQPPSNPSAANRHRNRVGTRSPTVKRPACHTGNRAIHRPSRSRLRGHTLRRAMWCRSRSPAGFVETNDHTRPAASALAIRSPSRCRPSPTGYSHRCPIGKPGAPHVKRSNSPVRHPGRGSGQNSTGHNNTGHNPSRTPHRPGQSHIRTQHSRTTHPSSSPNSHSRLHRNHSLRHPLLRHPLLRHPARLAPPIARSPRHRHPPRHRPLPLRPTTPMSRPPPTIPRTAAASPRLGPGRHRPWRQRSRPARRSLRHQQRRRPPAHRHRPIRCETQPTTAAKQPRPSRRSGRATSRTKPSPSRWPKIHLRDRVPRSLRRGGPRARQRRNGDAFRSAIQRP